MKKIVLIDNNARSLLLFRLIFIKKLLNLGFMVVVCVPYDKVSFKTLNDLGVKTEVFRINRTGMNLFQEVSSFFQIRKILRHNKPDVCLFYTIKPVIYGSLACRSLEIVDVCSMITGMGYVFIGRSFLRRVLQFFIKKIYKFALRNNKKVIFLNRDDLEYFISNAMVLDSQSYLINGEGVDLDYYSYARVPKLEQIVFLYVGRLLKDKGLMEYIDAARVLKSKYGIIVGCKIVGGLDDNLSCVEKSVLQSWIDEGIVDYFGYLADVRSILKESSVFVLPSYREGMPVSILEAMAIGRPIITTDAPGCRETVEEGVNGFLVPTKNVDDLVVAMERFIADPGLAIKMGQESRRIVEEKFDADKISCDIVFNVLSDQ